MKKRMIRWAGFLFIGAGLGAISAAPVYITIAAAILIVISIQLINYE